MQVIREIAGATSISKPQRRQKECCTDVQRARQGSGTHSKVLHGVSTTCLAAAARDRAAEALATQQRPNVKRMSTAGPVTTRTDRHKQCSVTNESSSRDRGECDNCPLSTYGGGGTDETHHDISCTKRVYERENGHGGESCTDDADTTLLQGDLARGSGLTCDAPSSQHEHQKCNENTTNLCETTRDPTCPETHDEDSHGSTSLEGDLTAADFAAVEEPQVAGDTDRETRRVSGNDAFRKDDVSWQGLARKHRTRGHSRHRDRRGAGKRDHKDGDAAGRFTLDEGWSNRSLTVILRELGLHQSHQRAVLADHMPASFKDDVDADNWDAASIPPPPPRIDRPHFTPEFVQLLPPGKGRTVGNSRMSCQIHRVIRTAHKRSAYERTRSP